MPNNPKSQWNGIQDDCSQYSDVSPGRLYRFVFRLSESHNGQYHYSNEHILEPFMTSKYITFGDK